MISVPTSHNHMTQTNLYTLNGKNYSLIGACITFTASNINLVRKNV